MINFKRERVISMVEFLRDYLDVGYEIDISRINHFDLDELNISGVKRVPNQCVDIDDIRTGRILLVEAKGYKHKGNVIYAYLRPDIVLYQENKLQDNLERNIYKGISRKRIKYN